MERLFYLNVKTRLLSDLASERPLKRLSRLHVAPRNLPKPGEGNGGAATKQEQPAAMDDRGSHADLSSQIDGHEPATDRWLSTTPSRGRVLRH